MSLAVSLHLDIVAVVETWESAGALAAVPDIPGFTWLGRPRPGTRANRHGGVGFFVAESLLPYTEPVVDGLEKIQ